MSLREWIESKGLNISQLALLLNLDRSYIHMWLNGSRVPGKKSKAALNKLTKGKVTQIKD